MADVIDSYDFSNRNTEGSLNGVPDTGTNGIGQSFLSSGDYVLKRISIDIGRVGSYTGSVYIDVYAHTGTYGTSSVPTGAVLATSDAFDGSTLATYPSHGTQVFTFSGVNQITLSSSVHYTFNVRGTSIVDGVTYPFIGEDTTSPTHGGNNFQRETASWVAYSGSDVVFSVVGSVSSGTPSPGASFSLASSSLAAMSTFGSIFFYAIILFILGFLFPVWYYGKKFRGRDLV